jgi:hypothetical protein
MKVKIKEFNKIATIKTKTLTNKGIVNKIKIKKTTNTEIFYR